jgi:hypothetical protein
LVTGGSPAFAGDDDAILPWLSFIKSAAPRNKRLIGPALQDDLRCLAFSQ